MQRYTYLHPNSIETTPKITVMDEAGQAVYTFQRHYSNGLKRMIDKVMDYRYFLRYDVLDVQEQPLFTCKKVTRKGKVFYEAQDVIESKKYMLAYDGWKSMIPDLVITDGQMKMMLHKEMEGWSRFAVDGVDVARWQAVSGEEFTMELEIEDHSPIQNPSFFIAISQCVLFIGA
ncbi:hypothetical protein JFL43_09825 [Viridibacillus sp. YIM B01967]|uniref:Tubby C-terminal domain-containing protein n=2 Tax=Viridibacillus soli TaxID=2798301 RepID=A0ABS1H6V7_9BACL|nr:hypothetical protein [Viridibacillus soli]